MRQVSTQEREEKKPAHLLMVFAVIMGWIYFTLFLFELLRPWSSSSKLLFGLFFLDLEKAFERWLFGSTPMRFLY